MPSRGRHGCTCRLRVKYRPTTQRVGRSSARNRGLSGCAARGWVDCSTRRARYGSFAHHVSACAPLIHPSLSVVAPPVNSACPRMLTVACALAVATSVLSGRSGVTFYGGRPRRCEGGSEMTGVNRWTVIGWTSIVGVVGWCVHRLCGRRTHDVIGDGLGGRARRRVGRGAR